MERYDFAAVSAKKATNFPLISSMKKIRTPVDINGDWNLLIDSRGNLCYNKIRRGNNRQSAERRDWKQSERV